MKKNENENIVSPVKSGNDVEGIESLRQELDREKKLRMSYEELLHALDKELNGNSDDNAVINELNQNYSHVLDVPEIQQAVSGYLSTGIDKSKSLREQGLPEAIDFISKIYEAGFNAANDAAKNPQANVSDVKVRLGGVAKSGGAKNSGAQTFSRADIKRMSPEMFAKYEKEIFTQIANGGIK